MAEFERIAWPVPSIERWRWRFGIPRDFWLVHRDSIGRFIKKAGLRAVPPEDLGEVEGPLPTLSARTGARKTAVQMVRPRPFPGGLKIAHLHYKGELFQLTEKQWGEFAGAALKGFQTKLGRARSVNFEELIEISDAIDGMH